MTADLKQRLNHIQERADDGEAGATLAELDALLRDMEDAPIDLLAAAHRLRIDLRLPGLEQTEAPHDSSPRAIALSLAWLEDNAPQAYTDAHQALLVRLDGIKNLLFLGLEGDEESGLMDRLDHLEPLAGAFLILPLMRGQVVLALLKRREQGGSSPFGRSRFGTSRGDKRASLPAARSALEAVVQRADPQSDLYREALVPLAEVYQRSKHLDRALALFTEASDTSPETLSAWQHTAQAALKQMQDALEDDLNKDVPGAAFAPLDKAPHLRDLPRILARRADLALLQGDLDTAAALYDRLGTLWPLPADGAKPDETGMLSLELLREINAVFGQVVASFKRNQFDDLVPQEPPARGESRFSRFLPDRGDKDDDPVPTPLPRSETHSRQPVHKYGLDSEDLRLYSLAGAIETADRRGDYETVQRLIYQLLEDRDLPAMQNSRLIDRLESLEDRVARQVYERQHRQAEALREAGQWAAARDLYLELVNSRQAADSDFMWLALAMQQAGDAAESLAQVMTRADAAHIAVLPRRSARDLLDTIADAGHWAISDRYAPMLNSARKWWAGYQERRAAYLAEQVALARREAAAADTTRAEMIVRHLLAIDPAYRPAALLLGRVKITQRDWSEARKVLTPLVDDDASDAEAARLLSEIDIAEGHWKRAHDRLATVDSAESAVESLRRRLDQAPYILLRESTEAVAPDTLLPTPVDGRLWNAYFAVRLTGVHMASQAPPIQRRTAEFLIGLHRVDSYLAHPHFAWRYIGQEGRLTIALLCRVEATGESLARATAETLWHIIRHLLPLQDEHLYIYEPVIHADELAYLLDPMPVNSAAQIVRAEPTPGTMNRSFYKVQSFGIHNGDMHRMLKLIAEHPGGVVVESYFHPTDVYAWERQAIEDMLSRETSSSEPSYMQVNEDVMVQLERSASYQAAAKVYQDMLGTMQTLPFIVQTRITAPGSINPALPEMVGLDLFGPSTFKAEMAYTETDVAAAGRNLRGVSGERWGYTSAPAGLERWRYLLTPAETLTATRLPAPGVEGLPGVTNLKVRAVPLPSRLPQEGAIIGESIMPVRGEPQPIRITPGDRLRHVYVVGRTGTGKSTLLHNMALQDIQAGLGVGVIDPHGDLVEGLLANIPPHRRHDVILFDPADVERPVGLNILDVQGAYAQNVVIADFIGLLYTLFDPNRIGMIGPRFENAVRNAMLTAMDISGSTFIEVVRILTDKKFREACLELVTDPVVKSYWTDVAPNIARMGDGDMLDYVTSKFGRFVNDRLMRNIIGQSHNALDFKHIMNEGKILLVNLAKGKIGPESSHFLGLLLMPQLFIAALSRARLHHDDRRLFSLYVDEFHNFTTPAFSTMLAEARKYGVAMTVANQFISQLTPTIREAVFGNVGTLLSFRVGIKDAAFLAQEFYPTFNENDLINLPNYFMLIKTLVDGNAVSPFPVKTLADTSVGDVVAADQLRAYSQARYGRDERVVNLEIRQRYETPPRRR